MGAVQRVVTPGGCAMSKPRRVAVPPALLDGSVSPETERRIRDAQVTDAEAMAAIHVASSKDAYAPLSEHYQPPDVSERARMWRQVLSQTRPHPRSVVLVAEVENMVVGFLSGGPARRQDVGAPVEVYVIHVNPAHRGHGVGSALWAEACPRLRGPALQSMYLETYAELRCCAFYAAHGGQVVERSSESYFGSAVTKWVYRWEEGGSSLHRR